MWFHSTFPIGGDVQFAESDGAYTAGNKAVGLESLPATTPSRVHTVRSRSTVALPPSPALQDPYSWPHDAQPRDVEDFTPSVPTVRDSSCWKSSSFLEETYERPTFPAQAFLPTGQDQACAGEGGGKEQPRTAQPCKSDKFDKYYHQTLDCKCTRVAPYIHSRSQHTHARGVFLKLSAEDETVLHSSQGWVSAGVGCGPGDVED